jgi:(S)-2-hydroxy-acid oxidase
MAGLPVPIPASGEELKILCMADLKEAADKKLTKTARGE